MFWIPYIRRQGPRYTAGCSPDPVYDQGFFGEDAELWTVTYPLATAYAWAIVDYLNHHLERSYLRFWVIRYGVQRLQREFGLPAKVRLTKVESSSMVPFFEPPVVDGSIVRGRLLTMRELVAGLYGRGYPIPPGFECALQQAILSGSVHAIPGIQLEPGRLAQCNRCGSQRISTAPCAHCGSTTCLACEDCSEIGLVRGCTPLFTAPVDPAWISSTSCLEQALSLTESQSALVEQLGESIVSDQAGCLVDSVCGSGKGRMILELLRRRLLGGARERILVTTPRRSVLDEWSTQFVQILGEDNVSVLGGGRHEYKAYAPVLLATLPQLYRFTGTFNLILIDEADAFPLGANPRYWGVVKRTQADRAKTVLFTATPQALPEYCRKLPRLSLPVRYHGNALPEPKIEVVENLQQMLGRTKDLIDAWLRVAEMHIYIFVPTKIIGKKVFSYLTKNGYSGDNCSLLYSGVDKLDQRIRDFRSGVSPIAITTTVLERGLTVSPCAVLVFGADHPNLHEASLVQMAGRSGRSAAFSTGEVVFLCQNSNISIPESARRHIQEANAQARRKGFLR